MALNLLRRLTSPGCLSLVMDESVQLMRVTKHLLGNHVLLSSSEVQAVDASGDSDASVILTSSAAPSPAQVTRICATRLLLSRDPTILATTAPYSTNLVSVTVARGCPLPLLAPAANLAASGWQEELATHFLHEFVSFVKQVMQRRDIGDRVVTFRFNWPRDPFVRASLAPADEGRRIKELSL